MARALTSSMQSAVQAGTFRSVYFAQLEFASQTLRLTNLARDISWNSFAWLGNGWLRPVRAIDETAELRATGLEVMLTGLPLNIIALVLNDSRLSNKGTLWFGALNSSGAIVADPYLIFSGHLDVPTIDDNEEDGTVTLTYESDLIALDRPNEFRFTDQAQQAVFAGDKGFQYIHLMEDWSGFWGKPERPKYLKRKRKR